MYSEDDLLPISGLQHLAFCDRRWALIHLEQQWEENLFTAEGKLLHEKAHSKEIESRPDALIRRTLMEELRPVLADRLALALINRRQVSSSGFSRSDSGGITMTDSTRKEILVAWQLRKQEEILHPFLNERIPFGLVPHAQALLLARYLRGDLDAYPSFLWK